MDVNQTGHGHPLTTLDPYHRLLINSHSLIPKTSQAILKMKLHFGNGNNAVDINLSAKCCKYSDLACHRFFFSVQSITTITSQHYLLSVHTIFLYRL